MNRLLSWLASKQPQTHDQPHIEVACPNIASYGQEVSGIAPEAIESVLQWLFLSLMKAQYFGDAHLFWLDAQDDKGVTKKLRQLSRRSEPIFLYRCGDRSFTPPNGYYWRM
jgi:hypothetical protein